MSNKPTRIVEAKSRKIIDLRAYLKGAAHTLLCVGPMSCNTVDAVIEFSNKQSMPIPLIASRRQVECGEFGGGYVNNWSTQAFAEYVCARDQGFVHLCRDHGGPWQGTGEEPLSQSEAMSRAKVSLLEDIASGFDLLHLDPSIKGSALTDQALLDMLFELYAFVCESARSAGRRIEIEVGTEQQSGFYSDPHELVAFLKATSAFCEKHNFPKPLFCVVQTGTLVKEMSNVGFTEGRKNQSYDQKYAVDTMEKSLKYLADIAYINGVFVKEHNGDYLSDGSLALRRKLEIGAVNVAPELGVTESKGLVAICRELGLKADLERMLEIFYESKKWTKWLRIDSSASDLEKAIIAGHYTFAQPDFLEIKQRIASAAQKKQIHLDRHLVLHLVAQIQQMSWNLGYFHNLYSENRRTYDSNQFPVSPELHDLEHKGV